MDIWGEDTLLRELMTVWDNKPARKTGQREMGGLETTVKKLISPNASGARAREVSRWGRRLGREDALWVYRTPVT